MMVGLLVLAGIFWVGTKLILVLGSRKPFSGGKSGNVQVKGVSVVVAAHNEADNLGKCLEALLKQTGCEGLEYEVVLVLDRCSDGSKEVVEAIRRGDIQNRIQPVNVEVLPSGWTGKKNALKVGIDHAKHDFLLFTDADCEVESQWISGMRNAFSNGADLVLGVGPLRAQTGLLGLLQRYETFTTALQYTGAAGWGMPYMGVGRSIGYTKDLYQQIGGFEIHQDRLSGDDDLLVNQAQKFAKTAVVHHRGAWAWSDAPRTWKEWFRQKMRHHSAANAYSGVSKLILGCLHGGTALFYLSLGWALTTQGNPALALAIWGCFSVLQASFLLAFPWPNRKPLLWCLPLLDVLLVLYLATIGALGLVRKPRWN